MGYGGRRSEEVQGSGGREIGGGGGDRGGSQGEDGGEKRPEGCRKMENREGREVLELFLMSPGQ